MNRLDKVFLLLTLAFCVFGFSSCNSDSTVQSKRNSSIKLQEGNLEKTVEQNETTPSTKTIENETRVSDENILSKSEIDDDKDGKKETIIIKMNEGKHYEDKDLGPLSGWKWEGKFLLELKDGSGKTISSYDLNNAFAGEQMVFKDKFELNFQDYNSDGVMDFTVGQYASSNGYIYCFFSINKDRRIVSLPFDKGLSIFSDNNGYSAAFEKAGGKIFKNKFYDNSVGKRLESLYQWTDGKFVRIGTSEISE